MATGRDVAQLAGTSTAVVSYVFNNGPRNVSPATRERVLAAAAELNYRPNALARALSFGRTSTIGLIVPDIANPYFGELARALEDAAMERGELLLIGDSSLDPERERRHIAAFVERRVDSVVMVSLLDEPDFAAFEQASIPVIALHPIADDAPAASLTIDYELAARAAAAHLVAHDFDSIGLLNGPAHSVGAGQHRRGFLAAMAEAGRELRHDERNSGTSRADASAVSLRWLAEPDRPRAITCATDEQAYGVLHAAYLLGLRVPQDLAVIGFDGTEHSEYAVPPLTTVRQPIRAIAARAIELVAEAAAEPADGADFTRVRELAGHELIVRASCGCAEG
ncbi:LacI family DNA-binding transcriptional regulator [Agromyces mediolanus]|uniref:HTH-type transcriptional regulator n=1 Tax=Agromyces mediolanus TaxID=41986 RepID=A0A918CMI0_AGRME|nr:LacI family DNA-binding transcriptional regulator [Agromyces mediolanus]GGR30893.1 putative HTH-type transcriptional regulator [Agromyces mediolanus]GLJ72422.1 putative HTH-type transcriptional regulator [Agromyces mediolanus]